MATAQTALVTGGNKGIGFETCRELAQQGFRVFLGARNQTGAKAACAELAGDGLDVTWLPLDVSDEDSIAQAAEKLQVMIPGLDALVNNAGIYQDNEDTALTVSTAKIRDTFTTNTLGPLLLTRALLPLLEKAPAAQVINLSSGMGQLSDMQGASPAYRISKTALNAVTRILAAELKGKGISVNSVCPGWVKTDMGGSQAPRTVQQGADTIVWLATGGAKGATGKFYRDRNVIPW